MYKQPEAIFCISLDFELHWGGFEKWSLDNYRNYFLNTRQVIPEMLTLFKEHGVHVTWATVGILLHQSKAELNNNLPALKPTYRNTQYSAYEFIGRNGIGENENDDPFHYAPDLVKKILATPDQELGTHTFSHFYCNEEGQTPQQFREDLRAAQRVAKNYGQTLQSLVFPRNQYNPSYLQVCAEEGITAIRSNPVDWFWNIGSTENESWWKRLNRGVDAYWDIGNKTSYPASTIKLVKDVPLSLPASRLLRPYRPKELFLNQMKINRICREMEVAARDREVYHLWWHPHNFGHFPSESLGGLKKILNHFSTCATQWQMKAMNMGEIAQSLHG